MANFPIKPGGGGPNPMAAALLSGAIKPRAGRKAGAAPPRVGPPKLGLGVPKLPKPPMGGGGGGMLPGM